MDRRRRIQREYNEVNGITPRSIVKSMEEVRLATYVADARSEKPPTKAELKREADLRDPSRRGQAIAAIERRMKEAAANLEFEVAALLRDQLIELKAADTPDVQRGGAAPPRPYRAAGARRRA